MTAMANIVAFDGAATPVSHTFIPQSVVRENGTVTATWKEAITTVPDAAQGTVVMSLKKMASGVYRLSNRVSVPVMESISGQNSSGYTAPPKVAYTDTVETIGYFHERGTITGRRLCRQLAVNIDGSIITSVAAVTTGPLPELFDLLIMPT